MDTDQRNKFTFVVHPINLQVDIQFTGSCEFWIRNVGLARSSLNLLLSIPLSKQILHLSILPEIYSSRVACIYGTNQKCQSMMAPEHLNILHTAFQKAKL